MDRNGHLLMKFTMGSKSQKVHILKIEKCLAHSQAAIHSFRGWGNLNKGIFCRILCQKLETHYLFFQDPKTAKSLQISWWRCYCTQPNCKRIVLQWKTKNPARLHYLFLLHPFFCFCLSIFSRSKMMISWSVVSFACPLRVKSFPSVMDLPTSSLQLSILLSTTSGISLLVFRYIFLTFHHSIRANYPSAGDSRRARWLFLQSVVVRF